MITCHSGGAEGSDIYWEILGEKYGVVTKAYSFEGHKTKSKNKVVLTLDELEEAMPHIVKANEKLKRHFPTSSRYVNALLLRNYYQIKNSDMVFAIGFFDFTKEQLKNLKPSSGTIENINLKGGTAWAVQMALDLNKPVHVFDASLNDWFYYNYSSKMYDKYVGTPNISCENFAGIGTREITPLGIKAIKWVYERTFNKENYWKLREEGKDIE